MAPSVFYIIYIMHTSTKTTKRATKPAKSIKINKITGERFRIARQACWLSLAQAAKVLQVTERTLHNWESGACRVPYAAYRLMRILAGRDLGRVCPTWDGWLLQPGKLVSPEGREFKAGDMGWLSLLIQRARLFGELHRKMQRAAGSADKREPEARGLADDAAAPAVGLHQAPQTGMVGSPEVLPSAIVSSANRRLKGGIRYQFDTTSWGFSPVVPVESCANGPSSNTGQKPPSVVVNVSP